MYRQQSNMPVANKLICPDCAGTRFRVSGSKVVCTNCDWTEKTTSNKYGAKRTEFNGKKYDSKYEAGVAQTLELRKKAKDIKDYDIQYKVEMWAYLPDGTPAIKKCHKVDFRLHLNDGSFELLEAKGVETDDYRHRREFLEKLWLPLHKDHIYTVIKQKGGR